MKKNSKEDIKLYTDIKTLFNKLEPKKRLLAIKINDFHFSIGIDEGTKNSEIKQLNHVFGTGSGANEHETAHKICKALNINAYTFWHSCYTHTFIEPGER